MNLIDLAERRWIPDALIRAGIRRLLKRRVREDSRLTGADVTRQTEQFVSQLRESPLAIATDAANDQHYEVPAEFFATGLGPKLKYSCCLYETPEATLAEAEEAMLRLTCERAGLADGQQILELGCGWGSLSLWMAEHYPNSQITAVPNSHSQREFIEHACARRGLENLQVITADMRDFEIEEQFDRVVSVEMFEHMRNYEELLHRVSRWLKPNGKLFVHIFCRRELPYIFEIEGADNWMGRHFFTGGIMPSLELFTHFADDLAVAESWTVNGEHYARTCDAWLNRVDSQRANLESLFASHAGRFEARRMLQRWRIFFMACAELFRFADGKEWFVAHYLLEPARDYSQVEVAAEPSAV